MGFVKFFAYNASHITHLTQKEILFMWDDMCKDIFKNLKTLLSSNHFPPFPI